MRRAQSIQGALVARVPCRHLAFAGLLRKVTYKVLIRQDTDSMFDYMFEHDLILVTGNVVDFRGAGADTPGDLHAGAEVHAGLICLTAVPELDIDRQRELFTHALTDLATLLDLVNQALEVHEDQNANVSVYDIPRGPVLYIKHWLVANCWR
jgi:hypothetical protein